MTVNKKTGIDINVKKRNIWRTLLSVLAIVAGSLQGAWAQADSWVVPASDIDLTGNTPYWIRHTATNGLNLATKAPLYGADNWKKTAVSAVAADLSDLTVTPLRLSRFT